MIKEKLVERDLNGILQKKLLSNLFINACHLIFMGEFD